MRTVVPGCELMKRKMSGNLPLPWYLCLNSPHRRRWLSSPHALFHVTFCIECNTIFTAIISSRMKAYSDFGCHRGYSAPKWTYSWEIVLFFFLPPDVFSHLFQLEPFSASHTTLGWDVRFRSCPSTPCTGSYHNAPTILERRDTFLHFFFALPFWNSNESRLPFVFCFF